MATSDREGGRLHRALQDLEANASAITAAQNFEELVFDLIDAEARAQDVDPVERHRFGGQRSFDGMLPNGLPPTLSGPTAVDIAFIPSARGSDTSILERRMSSALAEAARSRAKALLLVTNLALSPEQKLRLTAAIPGIPGFHPTVWDESSLEDLAARHDAAAIPSGDTLFLRTVERSARDAEDWQSRSTRVLEDLKDAYQAEGIALVLGAGISANSGLPSWTELVGSLFTLAFRDVIASGMSTEDSAALFSEVSGLNSNSPLQTARYLRRALSAQGFHLEDKVGELLYSRYDPSSTSGLLEAIATLCTPERSGPRVHGVVTYNFDDLLEIALQRRQLRTASIYRHHAYATAEELAIYHVHGFLPQDRSAFDGLNESLLAFSEEGYHQLYADPYHWTNITQLNLFRERTCLMAGLSLSDPNLRRLLEIASRGGTSPRHFAILRRVSDEALTEHNSDLHLVPAAIRHRFLDIHHALQQEIFADELGVSVIWVNDFDEMAKALLTIRN